MSGTREVRGPGPPGSEPDRGLRQVEGDSGPSLPARGPGDERLIRLMEEFRTRQRRCPNVVVRPWWMPGEADAPSGRRAAMGFVVEYCPRGVESAEIAVRRDRVRVEGPGGLRTAALQLVDGWLMDGEDRVCPETLANYLLRMADEVLEDAAA